MKKRKTVLWVAGDFCLEYPGTKSMEGYPRGRVNGKQIMLTREILSWKLGRPLRESEKALHKCDNPSCIRPEHLFAGTTADNNKDRAAKGRSARMIGDKHWTHQHPEKVRRGSQHPSFGRPGITGSSNPISVLTENAVREIRASNEPLKVLAVRYGVSEPTVHKAKTRKTWRHVS